MRHDLYLAWRYLRYHKARSLILIGCLSLIAILPLALHQLLDEGKRQMTARAEATPLLIGAKGSAVDLTLNTLYFSEATPKQITVAEVERVAATTWAEPLPIYARFRVHGHALIGVTLDYFDFRHLATDRGQTLAVLGDCVLGADAAAELGLEPGDTLLTTPENLFDLAGIYPLKLHVAGILAKARSPDDQAVFIDLQTAWVIEGLGHGHAEQSRPAAPEGLGFERSEQDLSADAKRITYTEITPENLDSFHFHGDPSQYPITGLIAVPHDRRSAMLLRGRYLADDAALQIVQPELITRGLLQTIFRVGAIFDAILMLVGSATLLALALVFALSLRLRQREMQTIFLLGCSRLTVARLVTAEIALITLASTVLCLILLQPIKHYAGDMVRLFVIP